AVLALPPWALLTADALFVALVFAGLAFGIWHLSRHRYNPRRLARLLESRLGISDNRLINAVEFADRAEPSELTAASVRQADVFARRVSASVAVDGRALWRA